MSTLGARHFHRFAVLLAVALTGCASAPDPAPARDPNAPSPLASVCKNSPQYCSVVTGEEWVKKHRPVDTFRPADAQRRP